jgi:ornithine cyclodeaminase/alanine dehydrogenase
LSKDQVAASGVSMRDVINSLEKMFATKNEEVQNPPKPGIYPGLPGSFIHAMPAYVPSSKAAGCKWISGYPENQSKGLNYINGLMLLNEPETGLPVAVMDATWITAMRTGAATGLSARYLARKDSRSVGLIACGVQGRVNLEALVSELPLLERVTCFDPIDGVAQRFEDEMGPLMEERYGRSLKFDAVSDIRGAVSDQDCVVSSGPW